MIRTSVRLLHAITTVLVGVIILAALALWRMNSGPVSLGFITPYLSEALEAVVGEAGGVRIAVGDTVLAGGGSVLYLRDVRVTTADGRSVAVIPELAVGLSMPALIQGKLALTRLTLVGPTLRLERSADGRLALDLHGSTAKPSGEVAVKPSAVAVTPAGEIPAEDAFAVQLLELLRRPPDPMSRFGALTELAVSEASIALEDRVTGISWVIPRIEATLDRRPEGMRARARFEAKLANNTAVFELTGTEKRGAAGNAGTAEAVLSFRDFDPAALTATIPGLAPLAGSTLPLSGTLTAGFDDAFRPLTARLNLEGVGSGTLALPGVQPKPLTVSGFELAASLAPESGRVTLERFRLSFTDLALALSASGQIGLDRNGALKLAVNTGARIAKFDATLVPEDSGSTLNLRVADFVPARFTGLHPALAPLSVAAFPLSGAIAFKFNADGQTDRVGLDLAAGAGRLVPPAGFLPEPVPVRAITLQAKLDRPFDPVPARLDLKTLLVDFGQGALAFDGSVARTGERLAIRGGVKVKAVPVERLHKLWPPGVGKGPRGWILGNVISGVIDEAWIKVVGSAPVAMPDEIHPDTIDAGISGSDLTVNYFKTLTPIVGISGRGTSDGRDLIITTTGGHIGELAVGDGRIVFSKLDTPQEWIEIDAPLSGPLKAALTVLDMPPLGYARKVDIDPARTKGTQTCRLHFYFPLKRDLDLDAVDIKATAALHGAAVEGIAGGLNATDGELKLALETSGMELTGTARLEAVPVTVQWRESFVDTVDIPTKVNLKGDIGAAELAAHNVRITPYVEGPVTTKVQVTVDRRKQAKLAGTVDFTRSRLATSEFGWAKAAGVPGSGRFDLAFDHGKPVAVSNIVIDAGGLKATGYAELAPGGKLARLMLNEVRLDANNAGAEVKPRPDGGYDIAVKGSVVDVRPLLKSSEPTGPQPPPPGLVYDLTVNLAKVITDGPGRFLTDVSGRARNNGIGWDSAELQARLPGSAEPLLLSYRPDGDKRRLNASGGDIGALMSAFDMTDTVKGGKFTLSGSGEPGVPVRPVSARIELGEFRVINAPVLGRLLNALSVTGLLELLQGEGLSFSQLVGDATWHGTMLTFKNVRTAGGALGLTTNGTMEVAEGHRVVLEGTIVPIYSLNRIIGMIPLVGDLLSGGEGQGVFAATYSLQGPIADYKVSVNPLAVLAPGFLRNLFFLQ
ncbi:MAG: AsmA-like C-terminal region-containing protein [Rhodospirillaceae bacterium]